MKSQHRKKTADSQSPRLPLQSASTWTFGKATETCELHQYSLKRGSVPIVYGMVLFDPQYEDRVKMHFPNSNRKAYGGCVVSNERHTTVPFCPLCRKAETEWLKNPTPETQIKLPTPFKDRIVHLKPPITVKRLAEHMSIRPFELISDLMQMKILASGQSGD